MKTIRVLTIVIALLLMGQINSAFAERKIISGMPYIHQVLDMDESEFSGHNACGPTSAVMMVKFNHLQPNPPQGQPLGHYVYNQYNGFIDKSGEDYNSQLAPDWIGNMFFGAHGYILVNIGTDRYPDWRASAGKLINYLRNHGLTTPSQEQTTSLFAIIQCNINNGLPLIAHSYITVKDVNYGHYLVVVGYDTGEFGNEEKIIVNEPYGNAGDNWLTGRTNGKEITYPLNGYCSPSNNRVQIDRILPVHPIGIYHKYPGWKNNENFYISDRFQEKYNTAPKVNGMNKLGTPYQDGEWGSVFVHEWPWNANSTDNVLIQNFKNADKNVQRYGTDGETALIYNSNVFNTNSGKFGIVCLLKEGMWGLYKPDQFTMPSGYGTLVKFFGPHDLGAPRSDERDLSGNSNITYQEFEKGYIYYHKNTKAFYIKWNFTMAPAGFTGGVEYYIVPSWQQNMCPGLGQGSVISKTIINNINVRSASQIAKAVFRDKEKAKIKPLSSPSVDITWDEVYIPDGGRITISYSIDNRTTFNKFAEVSAGQKHYTWILPFAVGTHYYLKFNALNAQGMEVDFRLSDEFIYGFPNPTPTPITTTTPAPPDPLSTLTISSLTTVKPVYQYTRPVISVNIANQSENVQKAIEIQVLAKANGYPDICWYLWLGQNQGVCVFNGYEVKNFNSVTANSFIQAPAGVNYQIFVKALAEDITWHTVGSDSFTVNELPLVNVDLDILGIGIDPLPVCQFDKPNCYMSLRNNSNSEIQIVQVLVMAAAVENHNWRIYAWLYDFNGDFNNYHAIQPKAIWDLHNSFQQDFFIPQILNFNCPCRFGIASMIRCMIVILPSILT